MKRLLVIMLIACSLIHCTKDELVPTILYFNSFSGESDLAAFTIGHGDISILANDGSTNDDACLRIFGWCLTPNLILDFGPYDKDMAIRIAADIKTAYGVKIYLQHKGQTNDYVYLESNEDLFKARKWNHYVSGTLKVPAGTVVTLWIDASNQTLSETLIDNLEVMALE